MIFLLEPGGGELHRQYMKNLQELFVALRVIYAMNVDTMNIKTTRSGSVLAIKILILR